MKKHNFSHYILTVVYFLITKTLQSLIGVAVVLGGYLAYTNLKTPLNLIISIPLVLGGLGLTVNFLWSIVLAIFSPTYNRGICKLCKPI